MASKKILIIVPLPLLGTIDRYANGEERTRSDIVREAMREYCKNHPLPPLLEVVPEVVVEVPEAVLEVVPAPEPEMPRIELAHPFFRHPLNQGVSE